MNRSFSRKILVAGLGVAAALGVATAAQARTDVTFSIGFPIAPVYVEPAPVYVQPRPVYVQPRPVYVQPRPVYAAPPSYVYQRDHDWGHRDWRRRDWDDRKHHWERSSGRGWN